MACVGNPVSRAQVEQKFRLYADGVIPQANIARVVGTVDRLEELGSVRQLMDWLRGEPRGRAQCGI